MTSLTSGQIGTALFTSGGIEAMRTLADSRVADNIARSACFFTRIAGAAEVLRGLVSLVLSSAKAKRFVERYSA